MICLAFLIAIGVRAGGGRGGLQSPQILGNSDFLGSKRKLGQSQLLKTFSCFYTQDSGCQARDEFLFIREEYHMLSFFLSLGTVLQWAIFNRELIRINFRLTF